MTPNLNDALTILGELYYFHRMLEEKHSRTLAENGQLKALLTSTHHTHTPPQPTGDPNIHGQETQTQAKVEGPQPTAFNESDLDELLAGLHAFNTPGPAGDGGGNEGTGDSCGGAIPPVDPPAADSISTPTCRPPSRV